MLKTSIHGYCRTEQEELRAQLVQLVTEHHGWILEDKLLSPTAYQLRFEVALYDIVEVYAAFQQTGVHLTPSAHRALTEMCLCQKHLAEEMDVQIVTIEMHVTSLEEESIGFRRLLRSHSA